MKIKYDEIFPAEIVEVQGKPYMFTNLRVDRGSIPEGLYAYDVGDDCDGCFWKIQRFVLVNHWATIIGKEPVDLDEFGQYACPPDPEFPELSSEGLFPGDVVNSTDEYLKIEL